MFIVTDINNAMILNGGKEFMELDNGYPAIIKHDSKMIFSFVPGQVSIHEVPDDSEFEPYKTCYTPELGFYPNPNWREPSPFDDEQYAAGYEQALLDILEEE